ncbi:hypothetical protein C2G38_288324 [Gigaspora rosea]|uniref:Uncharacterized protein n=1 Tax=Gigaspora rosea TaxID=44941 RepID=A0A397UI89_9GLOM|nr:hypothetical protein C2G38_288324 [Gigaspora rosea]
MVWDILTLEFIVTLPTEWDVCCTHNLVINDERTLLAIWFKKSVYIYSVDFQLLLSFNRFDYNKEKCHFLLLKDKVCLLIICEQKKQIHLLDPYTFSNDYKKGKETIETLVKSNLEDLKLSQPYIIKHNIIFYINIDNKLYVQNLVESLKDKFNNMNSKLVAEEVLKEIKKESGSIELEFNYEKWNIKKIGSNKILVSYDTSDVEVAEEVLKEIKEESQENKSKDKWHIKKINSNKFLLYYYDDEPDIKIKIKLLESKDLLMIITNAIFIWTIKMHKIRLHYFWSNKESNLELFQKEHERYKPYLLPQEFKTKIEDLENCDFNELMEEMIGDYIDSRFKLGLYGTDLMKYLLENQKFDHIEMILENIIKFTIQNSNRNYISNLPLMKIVINNFKALRQYPEIINLFLSRIAFFVPDDVFSEIVNMNSTSRHLQKFGTYPDVSEISLIYLKIGNFFNFLPKFSLRLKQEE